MRPRNLVLFFSLLTATFTLGFPLQFKTSATNRQVSQAAPHPVTETATSPAPNSAAADPNAAPIYSQPYDGRGSEGPSTKIPTGNQMDQEVADDFELYAQITRVRMAGPAAFNAPPNPEYHGVYVRFYEGSAGTPGAQQAEYFMPKGAPGVSFNAERPGAFDITLPTPFNAAGRHFISVQPVFVGHAWSASSGGYPNVRGAVTQKRDRLAGGAWAPAGIAGYRKDTEFDLYGTLQAPPRIESVLPDSIPRSGLLRINGSHFGSRSDGQLTIDGKPSQYIAHWADNLIVAYVPETSALGNVTVSVTAGGGNGSAQLNVTTRPADGRIRWRFTVAGDLVRDRAAIAPDGSVYFHDMEGRLYALSPDGGLKWVFQVGLVANFGPVSVGADGTVYVAGLVPKNPSTPCANNQYLVNVDGVFAINPDGTQKWLFDKTCDGILAGPNVGPDGKIHAVTDVFGLGAFALNPDGTLAHAVDPGRFGEDGMAGSEIVFGPAAPGLAPTQQYFQFDDGILEGYTIQGQRVFSYDTGAFVNLQPAAGLRTGNVYTVGFPIGAGHRLFAVTPQGALRWVSPIQPVSGISTPDTPPSESAVYVVQDGVKLHRVNPEDGSIAWTFVDNNEQLFDPIASPNDRLVLLGGRANYNQPGFLEAISSSGSRLWKQHLPDEPAFAPNGQVRTLNRARFTADGQTAYIAGNISGANSTPSNPTYSFFYALDTSDNNAPVNQPPKATLTSPVPNSNLALRTEINITARAEDDGGIARVEFYYNRNGFRTLAGSDTTPDADGSYSLKFTPTETGTYGLFAAAYDAAGLRADSPLVTITVSGQLPAVSWASPINGSHFAAPASIRLVARASDSDGTVARVEFKSYRTGVAGYDALGSDTTPDANGNYEVEWANPPQGMYEITASAIDNSGLSQSASITISIGPASTPVHAIGGTVRDTGGSPISGVSVTLGNAVSATAITGADGSYIFTGLPGGGNYSVTAAKTGHSFSPAQHVINNLGATQTANFTGARNMHVINGQIRDNNVALGGVIVTLSGGQAATTTTDANGNYSFPSVAEGGNYTVTPTRLNYTFAPANLSFNNLAGNQAANFAGTRNTHGIGGRVTENGNGLSGATVTLGGSQSATTTTDAGGNYSFVNLPAGGNYVVTPTKNNLTFSPANATFNDLRAQQVANFVGAPVLHSIGGRVSDAFGNGIDAATITLSGTRAASVQTDANGQYVLTDLPASGSYTVAPAKAGYTFNPSNSSFANLEASRTADFAAVPTTATVQFDAVSFTGSEGGGRINLTVTRAGNTAGTTTVEYATTDNLAAVRCDDAASMPGVAFARCDYATTVDRVVFAAGETSKTVSIPLIDDAHAERDEWVEVSLYSPSGAALGNRSKATVMITDNDAPDAPNALDDAEFFVRMQYLDFLNREPDADGMKAWVDLLRNCAAGDTGCDRTTVSSSFFRSREFQLKGYYVYLFYKAALGRLPGYNEITPDMRSVSGESAAEVYRKRGEYVDAFVARAAFREQYDHLTDQAFVDTLLNRYGLNAVTTADPSDPETGAKVSLTRAQLFNQLGTRALTRAQVLRAVVQSDEVAAVEYNGAFVAMQYYGYLRRTPEAGGFAAWLAYLDANPTDSRAMVNGFANSYEYRLRFGNPGR